jgi:uncharacterized protein (DUF2147 family)
LRDLIAERTASVKLETSSVRAPRCLHKESRMIRLPKLFSLAILIASTAPGLTAAEPPIYGAWARGDGIARVRIAPCGGAICAINTWIKPGVTEEKIGDKLVMNVAPLAAAALSGTAFDPQRNLNYRLKVVVSGKGMTTRGCVLGGLFCTNMGWTRVPAE